MELQQRDAEQGHAQHWHQKRIRGHTGGVRPVQRLQTEVDEILQVDQLRGQRLPEERAGERSGEPRRDDLREDARRRGDGVLPGSLRLPQLRRVPEGEPGDLPEEVQGHHRLAPWREHRPDGQLPEAGGIRTRRGRPDDRHQVEHDGDQGEERREIQRPDEDCDREPRAGHGRDPGGCPRLRPVLPDIPREPGIRIQQGWG